MRGTGNGISYVTSRATRFRLDRCDSDFGRKLQSMHESFEMVKKVNSNSRLTPFQLFSHTSFGSQYFK